MTRRNDSTCKSCNCDSKKHDDNTLLTCNACPSSYHADCLKSPPSAEYYEKIVWYCPSCAPDYQRIPLKFKNEEKYPQIHEPVSRKLQLFLKQHPYLQRDFNPDVHVPLFSMQRLDLKAENVFYRGKDHYMSLQWGRKFE